jgi:hypothetical protein
VAMHDEGGRFVDSYRCHVGRLHSLRHWYSRAQCTAWPLESCGIFLCIRHHVTMYLFDLSRMIQVNRRTGRQRPIRRLTVTHAAPAAARL